MEITYTAPVDETAIGEICALYATLCAPSDRFLQLMQVSQSDIETWFFGAGRHTVAAWDAGRLIGLATGVEGMERRCGYLSLLCVHPDYRRCGVGSRLLERLEASLSAVAGIEKLEVVFHCPVHLPWYIPAGGRDWHPCLPGVDMDSPLYILLRRRGWSDFAVQNAYYRRLRGYADPPIQAERRVALLSEGIELTLYDPTRHHGLPELFENIRNPGWAVEVLSHTDRPIVVAVDQRAGGLVVSYTGSLSVSGHPGRGNFCGIGTRTDYRGRGIGKLVFCEMCRRHAEGGAEFMSLYTGTNNPARLIYEAAGFRVVRQFADMRKEL